MRLALALIVILLLTWTCAPTRFNQAVWTSVTEPTDCRRYEMRGDIERNVIPRGTTGARVMERLGAWQTGGTEGDAFYLLGMCSGLGIDWDILLIKFDQKGRVLTVRTRQT